MVVYSNNIKDKIDKTIYNWKNKYYLKVYISVCTRARVIEKLMDSDTLNTMKKYLAKEPNTFFKIDKESFISYEFIGSENLFNFMIDYSSYFSDLEFEISTPSASMRNFYIITDINSSWLNHKMIYVSQIFNYFFSDYKMLEIIYKDEKLHLSFSSPEKRDNFLQTYQNTKILKNAKRK